jgi:hypothetical protein
MKRSIPLLLSAVLLGSTAACQNPLAQAPDASQPDANVIPIGTTLEAQPDKEISTGKSKDQERFILKVKNNSVDKNPSLKDAQIRGHLENVVKAASGKKASLHLVFDDVVLKNGDVHPANIALVESKIESKTQSKFFQNAGIVLGGAVAGKFLGDKTKFKHGGLAGGGAAAAFVLSSPGGEVVIKQGSDIKLKFKAALDTK